MSQFVPEVYAEKIVATMLVSSELLAPFAASPEARARYAAEREARRAYVAALKSVLTDASDPLIVEIAELHKADAYGDCAGCDFGGWEGDAPSWPCRTAELLGARLGLEVVDE